MAYDTGTDMLVRVNKDRKRNVRHNTTQEDGSQSILTSRIRERENKLKDGLNVITLFSNLVTHKIMATYST